MILRALARMWPYAKPYKRDLVLMFLSGFILTGLMSLLPVLAQLLMGFYTDGIDDFLGKVGGGPVSRLLDLTSLDQKTLAIVVPVSFPILYALIGIFRYTHYVLINYTAEKIVAGLRVDLVRKIVGLNLTYHGSLERGSGGLISRVFNDTAVLQQGFNFYTDLLREPFQALLFLGYMFWVDWKLSLFTLLFLPIFLLTTKKVSKSLRKHGNRGRDSMEDLTAVLKETVDGVRVVQSFNLEKEMESRFTRHMNEYLATARKIVTREQAVSPYNEFMVSFLVAGFAYYSINAVLYDGVDGARFLGFLFAAGLLQQPIKKLQDANIKIQQSIVVTDRVFSILDSKSQVPQIANPLPFPKDWKKITFRDVSFAYGGELTLKNVNLTVNRGEVLALVGESGSGKSTLVNLLERFYDPTTGDILIDDTPIRSIQLQELRHNIALVTQDVFLFRDTIERNIQAGDFTKNASGVESASQLANAHGFISRTGNGYQSQVGERGGFLSGGEKQRVSIARAIFKDAPILILDEATSALDSVSEMEVQKGLQHLMEGRTVFVIAHRLSTVFSADRILVMKKGEIVEQGSHQSLLDQKGEYYRFFQLQAGV
jgi:ATP-binding cassette, subfamily B, bacterial MsbA